MEKLCVYFIGLRYYFMEEGPKIIIKVSTMTNPGVG